MVKLRYFKLPIIINNMIKKIVLHFWTHRRQFAKYFIVGVSGVALDMGSLYALKEYGGLSPVTSVVINQIFIINYVFFLNKHWSFRASGQTHQQIVRFYILAAINYAISVGWMWVFYEHLDFNYLLARLANIALGTVWNFLLYKHWIYREPAARAT